MKKVTVQVRIISMIFTAKWGSRLGESRWKRLWQTRCLSWPAS